MKSLAAFVVVNAFFVAINLVAAGVAVAGGKLVLLLMPDANEHYWPWIPVVVAALGEAVLFARFVVAAAARLTP